MKTLEARQASTQNQAPGDNNEEDVEDKKEEEDDDPHVHFAYDNMSSLASDPPLAQALPFNPSFTGRPNSPPLSSQRSR